jgi:cytochrome P450
MNKHMKGHTVGDKSDLVHAFIERMNNNEDPNSHFGKDGHLNLKNLLADLFVAGTETVSTSLLRLILLLTTYPEIQEKVQQEIDSHVPRDQLPTMEHRSQ